MKGGGLGSLGKESINKGKKASNEDTDTEFLFALKPEGANWRCGNTGLLKMTNTLEDDKLKPLQNCLVYEAHKGLMVFELLLFLAKYSSKKNYQVVASKKRWPGDFLSETL